MKLAYLIKLNVILFLVVILSGCSNSNTEIKGYMTFYGATSSNLKRSFLSEMPFAARYRLDIYYTREYKEINQKKGLKGLLHVEALEFVEVDNEFKGWRIPWHNPGNDRLEKVYSTRFEGECEAYTSNDNVIINCALEEGETLLEIVLPSDRLVDGYVNDSLLCVDLNTSGSHNLSSLRICNGDNHWREQMMELWEDHFNKEIPDTTRKKYLVIDTSGYILSND